MNIEEIRIYCLKKQAVTESFPFDKTTLVFKVANKMFALMSLEKLPQSVNLKCDPELAIEFREEYHQVKPGYHMNKKHWNTVVIEDLPFTLIQDWIDQSYNLIVASLPKTKRMELEQNTKEL